MQVGWGDVLVCVGWVVWIHRKLIFLSIHRLLCDSVHFVCKVKNSLLQTNMWWLLLQILTPFQKVPGLGPGLMVPCSSPKDDITFLAISPNSRGKGGEREIFLHILWTLHFWFHYTFQEVWSMFFYGWFMRLCVSQSGKWVPHTVGGPRIERNISFIAHTPANHPTPPHLPGRWGGVPGRWSGVWVVWI